MKIKILLALILATLLIAGCKSDTGSSDNTTTVTGNEPPATIIEPPAEEPVTIGDEENEQEEPVVSPVEPVETPTEPVESPEDPVVEPDPVEQPVKQPAEPEQTKIIKFALKSGNKLYFAVDRLLSTQSETGNVELELWNEADEINKAGSMEFSVNDELIQLNESGETVYTEYLDATPDVIKTTDSGTFYCTTISPETAYSLGAQYKTYSGIFKDDVEISDWWLNQYECDQIISIGSEVYTKDTSGTLHQFQGVYSNIEHIQDESFIMHDLDTVNKRIWFNDQQESYTTNNILNAEQWIFYADRYYSENGYTWSEIDGLTESATELSKFQNDPYPVLPALPYGQAPVLLRVGVYSDRLYWIECNSGWLFRYDPDQDRLEQLYRLYTGDGLHQTGIAKRKTLKPSIQEGILYFSNDAVVYDLDLETGFINIFFAAQGEVLDYE